MTVPVAYLFSVAFDTCLASAMDFHELVVMVVFLAFSHNC